MREYGDEPVVDMAIARKAVEKLKEDKKHYVHIMMARCETKKHAEAVYKIYKKLCPDMKIIILYSGCSNYMENYEKVLKKDVDIVVCVNMLGEGFDLPELKIAAFHDVRKSLPITLQFAGRFTRTSRDAKLGDASFIANVADLKVQQEIDSLYEEDADWNVLLADVNDNKVNDEKEFKDFIDGFREGVNARIPVNSIYPKFSTVVYLISSHMI